jgi:hypothetical protein
MSMFIDPLVDKNLETPEGKFPGSGGKRGDPEVYGPVPPLFLAAIAATQRQSITAPAELRRELGMDRQ